jgi:hypothetical protein
MPSQVRIIRERNSAKWDDLVRDVISRGAFGVEHDYFGIISSERADKVRGHIRTAGKHQGVGSKVFWKECPAPGKCANGGSDCKFHVYYTIYDLEEARSYKARQGQQRR